MKCLLGCIAALAVLQSDAAIRVVLDAPAGKLISAEGARVTAVAFNRVPKGSPELVFDFEPLEKGPATLVVTGLTPMNWILHEDAFQLGKYTYGQFAAGVTIAAPVKARMMVDKRGGPQKAADWPVWQKRLVQVKSSLDGTLQPCYFWAPEKARTHAVPLIVGLHTWSGNYFQLDHYRGVQAYAEKMGWVFVGPNFRGPNSTPAGCGSDLAVQDIIDAIDYAKGRVKVDAARVYIIGGSGGGHMTLLMCGRHPEVFAGGAAFCPITDCARWYADSLADHPGRGKSYATMLASACGGTPAEKPGEYRHRSPLTFLPAARAGQVPVYIVTGIHDGWQGSVPVGHSFRAFNALADEKDRVSEEDIAYVEAHEAVPEKLRYAGERDPFYHEKIRIHFRRTSANVRFTLFEGGHGGNFPAGFDFLSRQKKGSPADFTLPATGKGAEERLQR